jgi:hypothetical protein
MRMNVVVEWLTLLLRILEVPDSNLRLSLLRYLLCFSVPPGKCRYSTLNQAMTASFNILSNSSFTYRHFIGRCVVLSYCKSV